MNEAITGKILNNFSILVVFMRPAMKGASLRGRGMASAPVWRSAEGGFQAGDLPGSIFMKKFIGCILARSMRKNQFTNQAPNHSSRDSMVSPSVNPPRIMFPPHGLLVVVWLPPLQPNSADVNNRASRIFFKKSFLVSMELLKLRIEIMLKTWPAEFPNIS